MEANNGDEAEMALQKNELLTCEIKMHRMQWLDHSASQHKYRTEFKQQTRVSVHQLYETSEFC